MVKQSTQREYMAKLVERYGMDKERVVREYAGTEEMGYIERKSNTHGWTAKQYAQALWRDGIRRGWISSTKQ